MKAMILVVSPKEYCNLLNGDLTILVKRDKKLSIAISNLIKEQGNALIYAYCTKGKVYARPYLVKENDFNDHMAMLYDKDFVPKPKKFDIYDFKDGGFSAQFYDFYDGKVIARFLCDKIDNVLNVGSDYGCFLQSEGINSMEDVYSFYKRCCIEWEDFTKRFIDKNNRHKPLFAIHITNLEIFDRPKEISEFKHNIKVDCYNAYIDDEIKELRQFPLTRAPRSGWCYVEV